MYKDQIKDIVKDCCSSGSTSVLSLDTTFNVGKFYLTSTTFQSSKSLNKKMGKTLNPHGHAMLHASELDNDCLYFIHTLLECNYKLERINFVGGGRDKAH